MTVSELIDLLKQHDPEMPVVVSGFDEAGYDEPSPPSVVEIVQTNDGGGPVGQYNDVKYARNRREEWQPFKAVHINF